MQNERTYQNGLFDVVKGVGLALAFSFLGAVVFAAILRATSIPDSVIYPVTQTIKGVAIALGALAFTRGEKGWIKGGSVGLLFTALSYLAFSAIGGDFSLSWMIVLEVVIAFIIGVLAGSLAVNLKR